MKTVYPIGTTLYRPGECCNGYTLVSGEGIVKLIDMNGAVAHLWRVDPGGGKGFIHRARLLADGRLLALFGGAPGRGGHVEEFTWDGQLTWRYEPTCGQPHHDLWPTPDGTVLLVCKEPVPAEIVAQATDPARRGMEIFGDVLIEVSRAGEVLWQWHAHDHLDINLCNPLVARPDWPGGPHNNTLADWTHINTVQALPENRWFDQGDTRFRPGNVLASARQLDTIFLVDRQSRHVCWSYTGTFKGGLSGQHESNMIAKGLPGAGHILVFDNGTSPTRDLDHAGQSLALEIDPVAEEVVWHYGDRFRFFSPFTSSCQRLANGNTMIFEAVCRRMFEVTADGRIVWEYITVDSTQRCQRYTYDYCPQTAALPRPAEAAVTPPAELRIAPDGA